MFVSFCYENTMSFPVYLNSSFVGENLQNLFQQSVRNLSEMRLKVSENLTNLFLT